MAAVIDKFTQALGALPEYTGWTPDRIAVEARAAFSSDDAEKSDNFVNALTKLPEYRGWSVDGIRDDVRKVFGMPSPLLGRVVGDEAAPKAASKRQRREDDVVAKAFAPKPELPELPRMERPAMESAPSSTTSNMTNQPTRNALQFAPAPEAVLREADPDSPPLGNFGEARLGQGKGRPVPGSQIPTANETFEPTDVEPDQPLPADEFKRMGNGNRVLEGVNAARGYGLRLLGGLQGAYGDTAAGKNPYDKSDRETAETLETGKSLAREKGIDLSNVPRKGPIMQRPANVTAEEWGYIYPYLDEEEKAANVRIGQNYKDVARSSMEKAEAVDPSWRTIEKRQLAASRAMDRDEGIMKAIDLGWQSFASQKAIPGVVASGDDNAIEQVMRLQGAIDAAQYENTEAHKGLKKELVKAAAMVTPMLPGILSQAAGFIPVAGPALRLAGSALSGSMWAQQGMGDILQRVAEEGGDVREALPMAVQAGILYAAIENMQVKQVSNTGLSKPVKDAVWKSVSKFLLHTAKDLVFEMNEEGLQETVMIGAVAKELKRQGFDVDETKLAREMWEAYGKEFWESFGPMAIISVPGKAIGGARLAHAKMTGKTAGYDAAARENALADRRAKIDFKAMDAGTYEGTPENVKKRAAELRDIFAAAGADTDGVDFDVLARAEIKGEMDRRKTQGDGATGAADGSGGGRVLSEAKNAPMREFEGDSAGEVEESLPAEGVNEKRERFEAMGSPEVSSEEVRNIPAAKGGYIDRLVQWLQSKRVLGSHKNNDRGWDNIVVNRGSVKSVVHHDAGPEKTALLQAVPRLIRDGIYLTTIPKNNNGLLTHVFAGKATIDDVPYAVSYAVREDQNGRRYYDHSLTKTEALDRVDDQAPTHQQGVARNTAQNTRPATNLAGESTLLNILKKHLGVNTRDKNISDKEDSDGDRSRIQRPSAMGSDGQGETHQERGDAVGSSGGDAASNGVEGERPGEVQSDISSGGDPRFSIGRPRKQGQGGGKDYEHESQGRPSGGRVEAEGKGAPGGASGEEGVGEPFEKGNREGGDIARGGRAVQAAESGTDGRGGGRGGRGGREQGEDRGGSEADAAVGFGSAVEAGVPADDLKKHPGASKRARQEWLHRGTRSTFFKRWFGDWERDPEGASKVVDEDGAPLVVFHGARTSKNFHVFDGSTGKIFFTDNRDVAKMFNEDSAYKLIIDGEVFEVSESTAMDIVGVIEPYEDLEWGTGWNLLEGAEGDKYDDLIERFNDLNETGGIQAGLENFDGAKEVRIEPNDHGIYEVYLNIRNPKVIDMKGKPWTLDVERDVFKFDGYDGMIVKNIVEGGPTAEIDGEEPPPSTVYIVRNSNQVKSADVSTENRGTFDAGNPDIRFAFAGEKGAAGLDRAEGKDDRVYGLQAAKNWEKEGGDDSTIKNYTGWERGADGKWRYEVDDLAIDETKVDTRNGHYSYHGSLYDLVGDNDLFTAYPELRETRVMITHNIKDGVAHGRFQKSSNRIEIYWGENMFSKVTEADKRAINEILAHEVQHAIQYAEGFAVGSSKEYHEGRRSDPPEAVIEVTRWGRIHASLAEEEILEPFLDWLADKLPEIQDDELKRIVKGYKDGDITRTEYAEKIYKLRSALREWENQPRDMYHRTAGEVEARNVQRRYGMGKEERRYTPAQRTEDVPRGKQIFVEGDGRSESRRDGAAVPSMRRRGNRVKRTDWESIQKGDRFNSVKSLLKKRQTEDTLPREPRPDSSKKPEKRIEEFLIREGIVEAANGRRVNLANPDSFAEGGASLAQRALHLITQQTQPRKGGHPVRREWDYTKVPFVWAIPKTISDADMVAEGLHHGNERIYYFKNYRKPIHGGNGPVVTHMVVTDKRGKILAQGDADGLITQFAPNLKEMFDESVAVSYVKKEGDASAAHERLLIPPTPAQSPTRPGHSTPRPTVALSDPAGVANTSGRRGDSLSGVSNDNIGDSAPEVNTQSKKSSDALPGDFPSMAKGEWYDLLAQLAKTRLAKGVVVDREEMRRYLERRFGKEGSARFMNVLHGSPHAFDKFSSAFIGTGEGNQSYGHGLYFTELQDIAEAYATKLTKDLRSTGKVFIDGKEISASGMNNESRAEQALVGWISAAKFDLDSARDLIEENIVDHIDAITAAEKRGDRSQMGMMKNLLHLYQDALELLDTKEVTVEAPEHNRNLYKVKIYGDKTVDELNFIHWDKPLTEDQLRQVLEQAEKEGHDGLFYRDESTGELRFPGSTKDGEWLYKKELTRVLGSPKAASEFLLRAGIDGIQYPTGYQHKGSHEDSYNYVVFDDSVIEIAEHIRFMATPMGEVYGFATEDGKIYLDPERMNANTPIHEYAHLWIDAARRGNKPLYDRLMMLLNGSDVLDEVMNDPSYRHLSKDKNGQREEALARAIAAEGEIVFARDSKGTAAARFRAALRDLWRWVMERLGVAGRGGLSAADADRVGSMTLEELVGGAARELLGGRRVGGGDYIREVGEGSGTQEQESRAEMYKKGISRQEAHSKLFERIGGSQEVILRNDNDGEEALLTRKGVRKMTSEDAVNKSIANGFTAKQHFAVASDIENLYSNSFKVFKHADKDNDANIVAIHRFAAPLGIEDAVAYITVKESTEHGKRIYSIENMKLGKLESTLRDLSAAKRSGTLSQRASLYKDNINKLRSAVNSKGKKSLKENLDGLPSHAGANGLSTEKADRTRQDSIIDIVQDQLKKGELEGYRNETGLESSSDPASSSPKTVGTKRPGGTLEKARERPRTPPSPGVDEDNIKWPEGILNESGLKSSSNPATGRPKSTSKKGFRGTLEGVGENPRTHFPAPNLNTNINDAAEKVNTPSKKSENSSAPRFSKRGLSDADRERRDGDPRWRVAEALRGILERERVLSPKFRFGDALVSWGHAPKSAAGDEGLRKDWESRWKRAEDAFRLYCTENDSVLAGLGFGEAADMNRDDVADDFNPHDVIDKIPEWLNEIEAGRYMSEESAGEEEDGAEVDPWTAGRRDAAFKSVTEGMGPHEAAAVDWDGHYDFPDIMEWNIDALGQQKMLKDGGDTVFTNGGELFRARRNSSGGWTVEDAYGHSEELVSMSKVWIDREQDHPVANENRERGIGMEQPSEKELEAAIKKAEADVKKAEAKKAEAEARKTEAAAELAKAAFAESEKSSSAARERRLAAEAAADKAKADVEKASMELELKRVEVERIKAASKARAKDVKRVRRDEVKELVKALAREMFRISAIRGKRASTMDYESNRAIANVIENLAQFDGKLRKLINYFQGKAADDIRVNPDENDLGNLVKYGDDITKWREERGAYPKFLWKRVEDAFQNEAIALLSRKEVSDLLKFIEDTKREGRKSRDRMILESAAEREATVRGMLTAMGMVEKTHTGQKLSESEKKAGKFMLDLRGEHVIREEKEDRSAVAKGADAAWNDGVRRGVAWATRPETVVRILDGTAGRESEFGPWEENVFDPLRDSYNAEKVAMTRLNGKLTRILSPLVETKKQGEELTDSLIHKLVKDLDGKLKGGDGKNLKATLMTKDGELFEKEVTVGAAMTIYAYSKNESGRAHLEGSGYITEESGLEGWQDSVHKITEALPQKYKDAVDGIMEYFDNDQYERMNPVYRREHFIDMPKEKNYWPIRGLKLSGKQASMQAENNPRAGVAKGMTKGRIASAAEFKELDFFGILVPALKEAEHYIAFNDAVRETGRLLNHKTVSMALEQRHPRMKKALEQFLKTAAQGTESTQDGPATKMLMAIKRNYTVAALGINQLTMMKQLDSIVQATVRVKGGYYRVPKAFFERMLPLMIKDGKVVNNWGERDKFIMGKSAFMRHRAQSVEAKLDELVKSRGLMGTAREKSMYFTQGADMAVVKTAWLAQYEVEYNRVLAREYKKALAGVGAGGGGDYIIGAGGESGADGQGERGKAEMYQKGISYSEVRKRLSALLGGDSSITLKNDDDGETARFTKTSIGKITSNAAVQKSIENGFTREQHYAVVSDIAELFKKSLQIMVRPDSNGEAGIFIHRYAVPLHFDDAVAYITIKESRQHGGKRIHTAEVIEIGKLGGMLEEARDKSPTLHPAPSFNEDNIKKLEGMLEEAESNSATFPASNLERTTPSDIGQVGSPAPAVGVANTNNILHADEKIKSQVKKVSSAPADLAHARAAAIADEAAVKAADRLIRRTQPEFGKLYQAEALRGNTMTSRLFAMFLTQQNQNLNNAIEIIYGARIRAKRMTLAAATKEYCNAVGQLVGQVMLPSAVFRTLSVGKWGVFGALANGMMGIARWLTGDDPEEDFAKAADYADEWEDYIDVLAEYTFGGIPLIGLLPVGATRVGTNMIREARGREKKRGGFVGASPVINALNDISKAVYGESSWLDLGKVATQVAGVPGWIQAARVVKAAEDRDPLGAVWSERLREDTGVKAAMVKRLNRGPRTIIDKNGNPVIDPEWARFDKWYNDNVVKKNPETGKIEKDPETGKHIATAKGMRFADYYVDVMAKIMKKDEGDEFKIVYRGLAQPTMAGEFARVWRKKVINADPEKKARFIEWMKDMTKQSAKGANLRLRVKSEFFRENRRLFGRAFEGNEFFTDDSAKKAYDREVMGVVE